MPYRFLATVLIVLSAALTSFASGAASTETAEWDRVLAVAERYVNSDADLPGEARRHRDALQKVQAEAVEAKAVAERELKAAQELLNALGPAPVKGAPPESAEVAAKRRQYTRDAARAGEQVALADIAQRRARELADKIGAQRRTHLIERLLEPTPLPLSPGVIAVALPELPSFASAIARAPGEWYAGFADPATVRGVLWRALFVVVFAASAAVAVRHWILRRFGRTPTLEKPPILRRFFAAVAEGVSRSLVPATLFGGVLLWVNRDGAYSSGLFAVVLNGALLAVLVVTVIPGLTRAVLAPGLDAWRIVDLPADDGRLIARRIDGLALVFAIDLFVHVSAGAMPLSAELKAVFNAGATAAEAILMIALMQSRPARRAKGGVLLFLRRFLTLVAVAAVAAVLVGYGVFGRYLIEAILLSAAVFGGLFLLRGAAGEAIHALLESEFARTRMNLSTATLRRIQFWMRAGVDPALTVVGLFLVAPFWGVPYRDLTDMIVSVARGFQVGNVTFSPAAIAAALAVFLAGMAVTRLIQRRLLDQVLPETQLDRGVQYSLSAGIGYLGVIVAAALAVAVAGVDLTNVALIAGALSVGIGFGLQNIVNNFVSGLILLVERPIAVGDWVVIGSREGRIKSIRFRATEIETWQRASVIIPNAEILSSAVMNWTLNDTSGRIEIPVGVAYGSDTEKVRDTLLACAEADPRVLADPPPRVLFRAFGDSSLNFELRVFTNDITERSIIVSDLLFAIDRRFRAEKIEIPYPQRVVHLVGSPPERNS